MDEVGRRANFDVARRPILYLDRSPHSCSLHELTAKSRSFIISIQQLSLSLSLSPAVKTPMTTRTTSVSGALYGNKHVQQQQQQYLLVFLLTTTLMSTMNTAAAAAHDIRFVNSCLETVWVGTLSNAGFDSSVLLLLANGGFPLDVGATRTIQAPTAWQGRFWGRTGCATDNNNNNNGSSTNSRFTCETGDCGSNSMECQGMAGRPPATLVEMTLDADCCGGIDFYDVSLVDGYNLPLSITPMEGTFQLRPDSDAQFDCQMAGCVADLNESCPNELRVYSSEESSSSSSSNQVAAAAATIVACQSACAAFDTDEFCCRGSFSTAETCPPFDYSKTFKASCPRAYSYAYDDQSSLFTCLGAAPGESGYIVEFCPGGNDGSGGGGGEGEDDKDDTVIDCSCPNQCTESVLYRMATDPYSGKHSCLDRIQWLMSNQNMNQLAACRQVGNEFPGICDQGCHPDTCSSLVVDCGCPTECSSSTLDQMATDSSGAYSCRERINWIILDQNMNEENSCEQVSQEFPSICGQGCTPSQCDNIDDRKCPTLIWSDEFDGTSLDPTKWEMQVGDGCDQTPSICGWGNNELQSYEQDNVAVAGGFLTIEARRQSLRGKEYTSGRIRTKGLADFQHGRLEAKIKIPFGQGMWPAFWMLPTESVYGIWPTSGEIDIMENIGREPSTVHATIHYGPAWPNNQVQGSSIDLLGGERFHDSFHEFAVEWQPNEIHWTMDGYEFLVKRPSDVFPYTWPFEEKFHFILNLAVGGNWPGPPDAYTIFPQQLQVDYVRVYESTFGRLTGPSMVEAYAEGVVYAIQDALPDYVFTWSLPTGASIDSSDPSTSNSITVSFGDESGYISVTATSAACNGIVRTFSVPVKVGGRVSDCGCGSQCAESTLDELATSDSGSFSCRDRINWLMSQQDKTELEACTIVSDEFPSICGQGCDPETCNEP